jgi:LysM repeat protein
MVETNSQPVQTITQPPSRVLPIAREPMIIVISKGDTVDKIAKDLGITVSDIAEANPGTNVTRLKVGQRIRIPRRNAE